MYRDRTGREPRAGGRAGIYVYNIYFLFSTFFSFFFFPTTIIVGNDIMLDIDSDL